MATNPIVRQKNDFLISIKCKNLVESFDKEGFIMELKVKMRLNTKVELEANFDGADLQDVVRNAGVLLDFDGICGFCQSEDISLVTRVPKGQAYKFTEFYCRRCEARRQFGKYQDGTGFFLKPWVEKFEAN